MARTVSRLSDNVKGLYWGMWQGYHNIQWLNKEYPPYRLRLLGHYSLHTSGEFAFEGNDENE